MDDFKIMFELIKAMYEGMYNKELIYDDFMTIFPKLKMIVKKEFFEGNEVIELINELLLFKEKKLLDRINEETIEFAIKIYYQQPLYALLSQFSLNKNLILRHLLIPYNMNKCEKNNETYSHMSGFEYFFVNIGEYALSHVEYLEIVRKYNNDLYNLILYAGLCSDLVERKTKEQILISNIVIHLFSIFYFKQDDYDNDFSLISNVINNIVEKEDYFINYCENEGICILFRTVEDCKNTYRGLIKLLDESYKEEKGKGRNKNE